MNKIEQAEALEAHAALLRKSEETGRRIECRDTRNHEHRCDWGPDISGGRYNPRYEFRLAPEPPPEPPKRPQIIWVSFLTKHPAAYTADPKGHDAEVEEYFSAEAVREIAMSFGTWLDEDSGRELLPETFNRFMEERGQQ